jgi:hypothetical protein
VTIGTGTFNPAPYFECPRSYIYQFSVAWYGDVITHSYNTFTIHAVPPDLTTATIIVDENWYLWNTNSRSLDHIVKEFYYQIGGVGIHYPLDYYLTYAVHPTTGRLGLFTGGSSLLADFYTFDLPGQPRGYWLPPPLP